MGQSLRAGIPHSFAFPGRPRFSSTAFWEGWGWLWQMGLGSVGFVLRAAPGAAAFPGCRGTRREGEGHRTAREHPRSGMGWRWCGCPAVRALINKQPLLHVNWE